MLIQCGKCQQTYNVPDELLSSDSFCFKCSACGNVFWMERQEEPLPPSSFEDHPVVYSEETSKETTENLDTEVQHEIHSDDLMQDEKELFNPDAEISKNDHLPFLKDEAEEGNPLTSPAFLPDEENVFAPQKQSRPPALWGRVLAFCFVLLLFIAACFFMARRYLYEKAEWTRPIYALFDYAPLSKGVSLENLRMQYIKDENDRSIGVRVYGQIENQTKQQVSVPLVRTRLLDENEQMVKSQYIPVRKDTLGPLESLPFDIVLSLSDDAVYVDVSFDEKE